MLLIQPALDKPAPDKKPINTIKWLELQDIYISNPYPIFSAQQSGVRANQLDSYSNKVLPTTFMSYFFIFI
ncbi:hypothetical protein SCARR_03309 [Pontiella sulfatireligans]|uniref:Uncharacterized protein n=1 Tax=Pontiella sulfatireligans TaxID=2750658 RepID=A0A6C2UPI9_9BACT|nr:hypothetical protein SCARR_03309 [Pontiella sulfatireligans]